MGKRSKSKECKRSSERVRKGVWQKRKKNRRRKENAGKVYGKNAV